MKATRAQNKPDQVLGVLEVVVEKRPALVLDLRVETEKIRETVFKIVEVSEGKEPVAPEPRRKSPRKRTK